MLLQMVLACSDCQLIHASLKMDQLASTICKVSASHLMAQIAQVNPIQSNKDHTVGLTMAIIVQEAVFLTLANQTAQAQQIMEHTV